MKKKVREKSANQNVFIRFFKRILFVIFFIVLLVIGLYFFVLPSVLERDTHEKNILIVSDKLDVHSKYIYLAHISENEKDNRLFLVNAQAEISVPGGYGKYPLQSVYQLLLIDKKDTQFIQATYSQLLGIAIDEVVVVTTPLNEVEQKDISSFFLASVFEKLTQMKVTDLFDVLRLHYQSRHMRLTNLEGIDDIQGYYSDLATVTGEIYQHCSVAVINTTQEDGLAKKTGAIIENTGALVFRLDNVSAREGQTQIYYANDTVDCLYLAQRISGIFTHKPEILPIEKLETAQQYRAKVIIFLGK